MTSIERREYINELRSRRLTFREIGRLLGISGQRAYQIATGYVSPSQRPKPSIPDSRIDQSTLSKPISTTGLGDVQGRDFTREAVRRRDNHQCRICLRRWSPGSRRFDIHHLNGMCGTKSTAYDAISDADKLITLCHSCHTRLESVKAKTVENSSPRSNKATP